MQDVAGPSFAKTRNLWDLVTQAGCYEEPGAQKAKCPGGSTTWNREAPSCVISPTKPRMISTP